MKEGTALTVILFIVVTLIVIFLFTSCEKKIDVEKIQETAICKEVRTHLIDLDNNVYEIPKKNWPEHYLLFLSCNSLKIKSGVFENPIQVVDTNKPEKGVKFAAEPRK